jgi:hypothetical protein
VRRNHPRIDGKYHELVLCNQTEAPSTVVVCDAQGQAIATLDAPGMLDFATTDTEVVVIDGKQVQRFARGKPLAGLPSRAALETVALDYVDTAGALLQSSTCPNILVWHAAENRTISLAGDKLQVGVPPVSADLVLPLSDTRWLAWQAGQLRLWRSIGDAWRTRVGEPGLRIMNAQLVLQGRLFALAQMAGTDARLAVVSMNDGTVQSNLRLPNVSDLRFASSRGYAVARSEQVLIVIDLRFGRVVKELFLPDDAIDFGIDASLQRVAVVTEQGVAVVGADSLTEAARRKAGSEADASAETDAQPASSAETHEETATGIVATMIAESDSDSADEEENRVTIAASSVVDEELPNAPLLRLDPIAAADLADEEECAQDLAIMLKVVGARIAYSIAKAWDSGRLSRQTDDKLLYELEVAGILDSQLRLAQDAVSVARERLETLTLQRAQVIAARQGRMVPLELLRRDFGLSASAEVLLTLIAAPVLRGLYARLLHILSNDMNRANVDEQMLNTLFGGTSAAEIARDLDSDMPLRKFGIVRVGQGERPFASLTIDPLMARYISRQPLDGETDPYLAVRQSDRSIGELQIPHAVVHRALLDLSHASSMPVRIAVRGRAGVGRHTFLAALAARAGRDLGVIDVSMMTRGTTLADSLKAALRRAQLRGVVPCVDGLQSTISDEDPDTKLRVTTVLRDHPGPLAIRLLPEAQIPFDPGYLLYDIPARNEIARGESWRIAIDRHAVPLTDASDLAARYRVGPGVIERVIKEVSSRTNQPTTQEQWAAALDEAVRQHLENRLGTTAKRITRLAGWADIVLPDDILDSLLELTSRVRHRKKVYETWGFDKSITTARGITALFSGTPGTGKTMVAGVIARDLGLDLYRVDVSRITSKWIGETEKNLGSLFDAAEDGQVMLLFDEADSLFGKRTEVKSSVDRYANMEVNYLLQRLDTFEGIAILTTNFGTAIDPAFKRRLTYRMTFPFPDEEMREKLWKALLPPTAPVQARFRQLSPTLSALRWLHSQRSVARGIPRRRRSHRDFTRSSRACDSNGVSRNWKTRGFRNARVAKFALILDLFCSTTRRSATPLGAIASRCRDA